MLSEMSPGHSWMTYWLDAAQRSILTLDVLRQRGNQFLEHYQAGKPPVLVFEHEVILDGRDLDRPSNYLLLRILPEADVPTDPKKRPFVIFDPRAGHGPGIGGSKEASQVGVALRAGHPVYFVSFRPEPVPDQTLRDVAYAEWRFLQKVQELRSTCQAGWAIGFSRLCAGSGLGDRHPVPPFLLGRRQQEPLRYLGGLMGGNWLASLASISVPEFDGVNLVSNFENLNPAAYLRKPYNLYSRSIPSAAVSRLRALVGYFHADPTRSTCTSRSSSATS